MITEAQKQIHQRIIRMITEQSDYIHIHIAEYNGHMACVDTETGVTLFSARKGVSIQSAFETWRKTEAEHGVIIIAPY